MTMDLRAIAMGVLFALLWSSAFTAGRIVVLNAPPLTSLTLRFLCSALLAIAIARALGQSWHLTRAQWHRTILFGVFQHAAYLGLLFIAMQRIEASLAAVIGSSLPLLVAAASWAWLGERTRPLGLAGLMAGLFGVLLILGGRIEAGADPVGISLCIVAVLSLTFATLIVRDVGRGENLMMQVGLQMLIGAAIIAPLGLSLEAIEVEWSAQLVIAFIYQVIGPGVLATLVWIRLIGRIGPLRAAAFHFLNPALGVAIAAAVLGETFGLVETLGVAVVVVAILIVQHSRRMGTGSAQQ